MNEAESSVTFLFQVFIPRSLFFVLIVNTLKVYWIGNIGDLGLADAATVLIFLTGKVICFGVKS